ncbi:hypothetical protein D4764_05G0011820 [Takifugu flavidus]|uniref:Reverse transcriptase domain-containing protein n=1 Tax=Takifugu flavidus TaxID=433684 RepID=A0A5C6N0U4_9TELE|nr:hypothetical protein D4764_05G0011820 [Takifugu flavidus]
MSKPMCPSKLSTSDYLTDRPQHIRLKDITSDTAVRSTGAPQGTVVALLLFTLEEDSGKTAGYFEQCSHTLHTIISNPRSRLSERMLLPKCRTIKNSFVHHATILYNSLTWEEEDIEYGGQLKEVERVAIFRTYCRDKITAPSHITNMDEIPLTFNIPLTHKVEKKGPARWRYAQRGTRSRRSPWFSAATETDRALDDGRRTLLHKDYEAGAGKLCHHMWVDCRRMGYDTVFMYCKSFHKIGAEAEPVVAGSRVPPQCSEGVLALPSCYQNTCRVFFRIGGFNQQQSTSQPSHQ